MQPPAFLATLQERLKRTIESQFQDARVGQGQNGHLVVRWNEGNAHEIELLLTPINEDFAIVTSFLSLAPQSLGHTGSSEFLNFIAYENFGLRGCSILGALDHRTLLLKSSFLAQSAASADETENLVMDLINLPSHAERIEERLRQCTDASADSGDFSLFRYLRDFYQKELTSLKLAHNSGKLFKGNPAEAFETLERIFVHELGYPFERIHPKAARVRIPGINLETILKIPEDCPILTLWTPMLQWPSTFQRAFEFVNQLNLQTHIGHFEILSRGDTIAHACYKPLTQTLTRNHIELLVGSIVTSRMLTEKLLPDFSD